MLSLWPGSLEKAGRDEIGPAFKKFILESGTPVVCLR